MQASPTDSRAKSYLALIDQGLVSGVNFITGLLLARFLGMDGYGQFVLAYGIILFLSGIQMALIISPMMVMGPTIGDDQKSVYYRAVARQQLVFAAACVLIVYCFTFTVGRLFPEWQLQPIAAPLAAVAVLFTTQDFIRRLLFVLNQALPALLNDLVSYGLQLTLLIVLGIHSDLTAGDALWIIALTSLAAIITLPLLSRIANAYVLGSMRRLPENATDRQHWEFGKWLIGRNIVYWGGTQLLIYMAGAMLSVAAVGAMTAARNIVGLTNLLFLAMENLVPSRAARIYSQRGIAALGRYLRRVSVIGGGLTLAIVGIAAIAPEFWLKLFYGEAYQGYGWVVIWWCVFNFIGFFHRPLTAGLRTLNQTKAIFTATLMGTIVVALIGYAAIQYAQLHGAMISLVAVQLVILISLFVKLKKEIRAHSNA